MESTTSASDHTSLVISPICHGPCRAIDAASCLDRHHASGAITGVKWIQSRRFLSPASEYMKYLLVILLLASFVSLEVYHELSNGDMSGSAVCMAPESKQDAMAEMFRQHQQSH